MGSTSRSVRALLLVAATGAFLASSGSAVRAEDRPGEVSGVWVYDLRVVQVDAPSPEAVEGAPALTPTEANAATVRTGWPDILATLKARGNTTLLIDRRLTSVGGSAEVTQRWTRNALVLSHRAGDMSQWTHQLITTGVDAKITTSGGAVEYRISIQSELAPESGPEGSAVQGSATWSGTHPSLSGSTLVLGHREQVRVRGGPAQGIEFHAFLTGAWVPTR
jgi:hypothetical protein